MFNLETIICNVRMKDGTMFPLTVEKLDAGWLENLMFAQPENYDKCLEFIRGVELEKSYPLLWEMCGDLRYNKTKSMYANYDNLGEDEKMLLCIYRLRALKLMC